MKKSKALIKTQRRSLDRKLKLFNDLLTSSPPRTGWIKAIRESLGMTSSQLASRMGIQQSGVILLEQREIQKKVSLETLERAAQALQCKLVYALIPEESLEKTLQYQAELVSEKIFKRTLHTMDLEMQKSNREETELHRQELITSLIDKLDKRLWDKE